MAKKVKRPRDTNQLAKHIMELSTGGLVEEPEKEPTEKAKNASKGGKARAKKLTKTKKSEIAKKAADKRWKKGAS